MNPLDNYDPAHQQAQLLSARLGNLAAQNSLTKPDAAFSPGTPSPRLAALLQRLHRHRKAREGYHDLRVAEFVAP